MFITATIMVIAIAGFIVYVCILQCTIPGKAIITHYTLVL